MQTDNFPLSLDSAPLRRITRYESFFLPKNDNVLSESDLWDIILGARNGAIFKRNDTPFLSRSLSPPFTPSFFSTASLMNVPRLGSFVGLLKLVLRGS
jgi:hypothetical protein